MLTLPVSETHSVYLICRRAEQDRHKQQALAYGCCSFDQIVRRSESVCKALAPQADSIEFMAEKLVNYERRGNRACG